MAFQPPARPYDFVALAPHTDAHTMEVHPNKPHHADSHHLTAQLD